MTTSATKLAAEILVEIKRGTPAPEIRRRVKQVAKEAEVFAKMISPVLTGAYQRAWHIENRPERDGLPHYALVNDDEKANWIEYGTGPDTRGKSTWGPNTPTPDFAVARRTALKFGGGK